MRRFLVKFYFSRRFLGQFLSILFFQAMWWLTCRLMVNHWKTSSLLDLQGQLQMEKIIFTTGVCKRKHGNLNLCVFGTVWQHCEISDGKFLMYDLVFWFIDICSHAHAMSCLNLGMLCVFLAGKRFVEGDKGNSKDTPVLIWLNGASAYTRVFHIFGKSTEITIG